MKPELVEKKILKNLIKKKKGSNKYFSKGYTSFKNIFVDNWYIILILGLICLLLFLRFKDTNEKKLKEPIEYIKDDKDTNKDKKNAYETLANSNSYESDYYSMLHKIRPNNINQYFI
jgi:hypothetical protein